MSIIVSLLRMRHVCINTLYGHCKSEFLESHRVWRPTCETQQLIPTRPSVFHIIIIYILQVNKKFCELKGGNIGIVEKAQETRFGMSPKYSSYIGIES